MYQAGLRSAPGATIRISVLQHPVCIGLHRSYLLLKPLHGVVLVNLVGCAHLGLLLLAAANVKRRTKGRQAAVSHTSASQYRMDIATARKRAQRHSMGEITTTGAAIALQKRRAYSALTHQGPNRRHREPAIPKALVTLRKTSCPLPFGAQHPFLSFLCTLPHSPFFCHRLACDTTHLTRKPLRPMTT